jgi:hypothetical protein
MLCNVSEVENLPPGLNDDLVKSARCSRVWMVFVSKYSRCSGLNSIQVCLSSRADQNPAKEWR